MMPQTEWLETAFVVFCRVGACLMTMWGWSSSRIPARARLFIAIGMSLALVPLAAGFVGPVLAQRGASGGTMLMVLGSELAAGMTIGLAGRLFLSALQFAGHLMATVLGFVLGEPGLEDGEPSAPLTEIVTWTATALFFLLDLHVEVLAALLDSYRLWPPAAALAPALSLEVLTKATTRAFNLALQISAPLLVYAVAMNFALGLANRLLPQVPMQFVAAPVVLYGGICVLFVVFQAIQWTFARTFDLWLRGG